MCMSFGRSVTPRGVDCGMAEWVKHDFLRYEHVKWIKKKRIRKRV